MDFDNIVDMLYTERDIKAYQGTHTEFEENAINYPGRGDNVISTTQDNHRRYDIMDRIFIENY